LRRRGAEDDAERQRRAVEQQRSDFRESLLRADELAAENDRMRAENDSIKDELVALRKKMKQTLQRMKQEAGRTEEGARGAEGRAQAAEDTARDAVGQLSVLKEMVAGPPRSCAPRHQRTINPRFLNHVASYDVASNICQAIDGGDAADRAAATAKSGEERGRRVTKNKLSTDVESPLLLRTSV
jgi:hypothetical protein